MKIGYFAYYADEEKNESIVKSYNEALKKIGAEKIICDQLDILDERQEQLSVLMEMVREGDIIYTPEIKTMVNNIEDFLFIEQRIQDRGVDVVFIKEGIDTRTEEGRGKVSMFKIIAGIIEEDMERGLRKFAQVILPDDDSQADETSLFCEDFDDFEEPGNQKAFDDLLESLLKVPDPLRADNVVPIQKKKPSARKKGKKK